MVYHYPKGNGTLQFTFFQCHVQRVLEPIPGTTTLGLLIIPHRGECMYRVSGVGMGKWEGAGEVVRKSLSLSQVGYQHQRNKGKK